MLVYSFKNPYLVLERIAQSKPMANPCLDLFRNETSSPPSVPSTSPSPRSLRYSIEMFENLQSGKEDRKTKGTQKYSLILLKRIYLSCLG